MTIADETCDNCGAYVDSMNSDAIARHCRHRSERYPHWHLWCGIECAQEWVLKDEVKEPN